MAGADVRQIAKSSVRGRKKLNNEKVKNYTMATVEARGLVQRPFHNLDNIYIVPPECGKGQEDKR